MAVEIIDMIHTQANFKVPVVDNKKWCVVVEYKTDDTAISDIECILTEGDTFVSLIDNENIIIEKPKEAEYWRNDVRLEIIEAVKNHWNELVTELRS